MTEQIKSKCVWDFFFTLLSTFSVKIKHSFQHVVKFELLNYFQTLCKSICLKITQNVAFAFWHFPPIFVLLKLTCLVTLFDRKLQVFKNSPKWTIFGILNQLLSTQNVNVARFARDVEWYFFCDFQTPCKCVMPINIQLQHHHHLLWSTRNRPRLLSFSFRNERQARPVVDDIIRSIPA